MNPNWSTNYASQQEILDYLDNLADHYGLTDRIEFGCKAVKSTWNPVTYRWHVELDSGEVNHKLNHKIYFRFKKQCSERIVCMFGKMYVAAINNILQS